jgi:hypothetical protein
LIPGCIIPKHLILFTISCGFDEGFRKEARLELGFGDNLSDGLGME